MSTPETSGDRIVIDVDRDSWTKGLQLNIAQVDENSFGWGYRLHGPKYNGSSKNLLRHVLDERDAGEIRKVLDAVFPQEVPLCDDCGHLEAAHKAPAEEPDDGGCDASGARLAKCTCDYFIPRAAEDGADRA